MADKLTRQQAQAVYDRGGNLLVSAAAGSGKTKVLVDRLMSYLTDTQDPANLDEFLIITYTKAAASELRGKIASKITERIAQEPENRHLQKQMQRLFLTKISTVHGFCGDLLREFAYKLDIPADFRVADENECREIRVNVINDLLDQAYENISNNGPFRDFIDTQGLGRDDRLIPEIIEKVYDNSRCHLNPEVWLQNSMDSTQLDGIKDAAQTVWGSYLMKDLKEYVSSQIHVLQQCILKMEQCNGLEKPVLNLKNTLYQLQSIQEASSWDEVVRLRVIEYGTLTFPKKNNPDPDLCDRVKAVRNACKKGMERKLQRFSDNSERIIKELSQSSDEIRGLVELVRNFGDAYELAKKRRRVLDFSDLEHKTLDLLVGKNRNNQTTAALEIGRRYREILVDEYQDSNGVQDKIFETLTKEKHNCFMVGDVKQSIYQFRLADPSIFLKKYHQYVSAEDAEAGQGRKVLLSHNFRSGPEIISAVNDVFYACMSSKVGGLEYGREEALQEGIPHEVLPDSGVELYAIDVKEESYPEEAAFVAQKIKDMLSMGTLVRKNGIMKPVEPDDIVILLRSPGSAAEYFKKALEERGIRCSSGGGNDLLKTQEIGMLRSFLEIIINPRQDIPLISTLASPVFGFTADELAQIRCIKKKGFFYDALMCCNMQKAKAFLEILNDLRQESRRSSLTQLLETCIARTRLDSIYAAMQNGEIKNKNLQIFFQLAVEFEKGSLRDLSQFLEHLDALESRGLIMGADTNSGCVTVMSIHKSKGLEFPVVFLSNLARKFNQESVRAQILCDKELGLGLSVADTQKRIRYPSIAKHAIAAKMLSDSISEEMRVLYVAMTRARDRLIMTYAAKNLKADLQDLALRQDFDNGVLVCQEAICPGEWVLAAALRKTEAGELHLMGGRPMETIPSEFPWKICVVDAPSHSGKAELVKKTETEVPENIEYQLSKSLEFRYPYIAATTNPSKRTATDRKGRIKDIEAAEDAQESRQINRVWRKPSFISAHMDKMAYGNAVHKALQYLPYEKCENSKTIEQEISRLVSEGFLSAEQELMINCEKIAAFFNTKIGKKLRSGKKYLREFKFSILDDGRNYGEGLDGEQVLLQGVVDCALLEESGITVIDFKTDYVTEYNLESISERYRTQVQTYAEALERIFETPVKEKYLYFFELDRFVQI